MLIVLDVNLVFSALLGEGDSFDIFAANVFFNKFEFIAPEFFLVELEKHKKEFLERSEFSEEGFNEVLDIIIKQINFIPFGEFSDFEKESAKILSSHLKDVPYLALALKYNCFISSGDKILKKIIPDKVLNPKEMLDILYKGFSSK
jgi:predicted nucleic acid-binding protein